MIDESGTDAEELLLRWRQGQLDARVLYTAIRCSMRAQGSGGPRVASGRRFRPLKWL